MKRLLVIEIPGLSRAMAEQHAPNIAKLGTLKTLDPELPALTMPAHASLVTGLPPAAHGVVANGWYYRDHNEVMMWRQGEGLVSGEKVWEAGKKRDPEFTCLKHFWWPGMGSTADLYTNVRPAYFADGRKSGDVYANLQGLADELRANFGPFPLFQFWGPGVDMRSTEWIAATARHLFTTQQPTLSLVYLPHLDYRQQTHGPGDESIAAEVAALDAVTAPLIDAARNAGAEVTVLSSYTMQAVSRPVHLNRILREAKLLHIMHNPTGELIDFGMSKAFAVADHQVANVYTREIHAVRSLLEGVRGVAQVEEGVHPHHGDLVVYAEPDAWFTYYYWKDDAAAPDFARTVAIHAKPGYDPCEMFLDPTIALPKLKIAGKLARKALGMRYLMDVIPLDASLVKGSHGLKPAPGNEPLYVSTVDSVREVMPMCAVKDEMLRAVFDA